MCYVSSVCSKYEWSEMTRVTLQLVSRKNELLQPVPAGLLWFHLILKDLAPYSAAGIGSARVASEVFSRLIGRPAQTLSSWHTPQVTGL